MLAMVFGSFAVESECRGVLGPENTGFSEDFLPLWTCLGFQLDTDRTHFQSSGSTR